MLGTVRRVGLVLAAAAAFLAVLPGAGAVADEPGFSWWRFATEGPDDPAWYVAKDELEEAVPADGTIEGWQFARPVNGEPPFGPSVPAFFEDVCGESKKPAGKKRIGVVVDYGDKEPIGPPGTEDPELDALPDPPARPKVECAVVDEDATSMDVLLAVARPLRDDAGKICAIDRYPEAKCGTTVEAGSASVNDTTFYAVGGALLLIVIVGGGFWVVRGWGR